MEDKLKGGATNQVNVSSDGKTIEITEKDKMEPAILSNNEAKYHMCEGGSILLEPESIELLGKYGEGPRVIDVLDGCMDYPDSFDSSTRAFLDACKRDPTVTNGINAPEYGIINRYFKFKESWRTRKEKTCTYRAHIGHYKAMIKHPYLSWLIFQRSEIPDKSGYSPSRHKQCVDLMILKKSQNYNIDRQRIIGILETEFNHSNRSLGRAAMDKAITCGAIANEQFSRPGRSAMDESILKRITTDHQYYKRECYAQTSVDLENNYDRIVHTAAALALLRIGVSHAKIHSMFETIQKMVHRVRTAFGESEGTYGGEFLGDWENYPRGMLQGNACAPTIWSILSSVVYNCLHKKGFSNFFCSALSKEIFTLVGFSYVDDTDLFQTGASPLEVLISMQQLMNEFGSLMRVTGAAVAPDKSWYYLIDYTWKRGKWIAYDPGEHYDLVATTDNGTSVSLRRLCNSEAAEMLGIWMAPSFNESKQINVLKSKTLAWGAKVRLGNCSQYESWIALHTNISARLKYSFPASTLSSQICTSIMSPAIKAALPRAGICATISTDIRNGPSTSGGLGTLSLYDYQGTTRTTALIEHSFRSTPLGKMMKILIEDIIQEIGLYGPLWNMNFDNCSKWISDHSWIFHTCKYNWDNKINISIKHTELLPQRINDHSIMAAANTLYSNKSTLRSINRVRMLHKIYHLSDITTANGNSLDPSFLKSREFDGSRNQHAWPLKHHVTKSDYSRWRKFVKIIYSADSLQLPTKLKNWTISTSVLLQSWDWFTTTDREFLFHRANDKWHRHLLKPTTHRSYYTDHLTFPSPPSITLLPATIKTKNNSIDLLNYFPSRHISSTNEPTITIGPFTFKANCQQCFFTNISHSDNLHSLYNHVIDGTALAVSDGTFYPSHHIGAFGWIISTPDLAEWIQGGSIVPGELSTHSAYRAELCGQAGIAFFFYSLILPDQEAHLQKVYSDCISALNRLTTSREYIKSTYKHMDIISLIIDLWDNTPFRVNPLHVKAHQDNLPSNNLSPAAKLNCSMDTFAKQIALHAIIQKNLTPPTFNSTLGFGTIKCNSKTIHNCLQKNLYHLIAHNNFINKASSYFNIPSETFNSLIDWDCFKVSRSSCRFGLLKFISKFIAKDISTGKVMVRRKQRLLSNCPLCGNTDEDNIHVLTCPSASTLRCDLIIQLQSWLNLQQTDPSIISFLIDSLQKWFSNPSAIITTHSTDNILNTAFTDQTTLGWYAFLCGYICKPLIKAQSVYYLECGSQRSAMKWGSNLISQCWNITYQLWMNRNNTLHTNNHLPSLHGLPLLKLAIETEYTSGIQDLPHIYRRYFCIPLTILLKKPPTYLRRWFLVIRSGRESLHPDHYNDIWIHNAALRRWIGLSPKSEL